MRRDWRIEAFRCLMGLLVVLNHAAEQGGYADGHRWLGNVARICVPGFVFISGYFGLRFSWKHILQLFGICVYCACVSGMLELVLLGGGFNWSFVLKCYGDIQGAWFVWCYLALMCVTPLLNPLFEKENPLIDCVPLLFLAFIWSYFASTIPGFNHYLPKVNGFGAFSLLTFMGIYVVGRLYRIYSVEKQISSLVYIIAFPICLLMVSAGFQHYCSPFNIGIVIALFSLFKRLPESWDGAGRIFRTLGPSMLSVYLLHDSSIGLAFLRRWEKAYICVYGYYPVVLSIVIVFFVCSVLLDSPRRMIFSLAKK